MQDFESIALGLVATPAKGNLDGKQHIEFSHSESARLAQFPNSTDYNITLKILEGECEKLETAHMRAYKDKELFERTGLIAVAARLLYEKYMKEVNYHAEKFADIEEYQAVEEEVKAMTPQQLLINQFGM